MTFIARYAGICANCEGRIEVGAECTYDLLDEVIHVRCPDPLEIAAGEARCERCFCFHAGECA